MLPVNLLSYLTAASFDVFTYPVSPRGVTMKPSVYLFLAILCGCLFIAVCVFVSCTFFEEAVTLLIPYNEAHDELGLLALFKVIEFG